tara:strand:- start:6896 stop:8077 length:1182 start_codon:yes stop_codon:yes gene_type:complete
MAHLIKIKLIVIGTLLLASCSNFPTVEVKEVTPLPHLKQESSLVRDITNLNCVPASNCLEIIIVNVGQGSSALVRMPNRESILFDAGTSSEQKAAIEQINNAFNTLALSHVDYLVLSHPDKDHINLLSKIEKLDVTKLKSINLSDVPESYDLAADFFNKVYDSNKVAENTKNCDKNLKNKQMSVTCYDTEYANNGNNHKGVWPLGAYPIGAYFGHNANSRSLVSGVRLNQFIAIFPGDAEGITEKKIMEKANKDLYNDSTLYVAAHHGATTNNSNDVEWLKAMIPKTYSFSAKKVSNWLHPDSILINSILKTPQTSSNLGRGNKHVFTQAYIEENNSKKRCNCDFEYNLFNTLNSGNTHYISDGINYFIQIEKDTLPNPPEFPDCPTTVRCSK